MFCLTRVRLGAIAACAMLLAALVSTSACSSEAEAVGSAAQTTQIESAQPSAPRAVTVFSSDGVLKYPLMDLNDYPLPLRSDLVVLPMGDQSQLVASWNHELREMASRMIHARLALAGRPASGGDTQKVLSAVSRRGYNALQMRALSESELVEFGKYLNTRNIVQISITQENEPRELVLRAVAADVETGQVIGRWSRQRRLWGLSSVLGVDEMLRDVANEIASDIVERFEHTGHTATPLTAAEREQLLGLVVGEWGLPALLEAERRTSEAIFQGGDTDLDTMLIAAFAMYAIEARADDARTALGQEIKARSLVLAELLREESRNDPRARFARGIILGQNGRIQTVIAERENRQRIQGVDDFLDYFYIDIVPEYPDAPESFDGIALSIWQTIESRTKNQPMSPELLDEVLELEPFHPYRWAYYGHFHRGTGRLNASRMGLTMASIQSSIMVMIEAIDALERAGHDDAAAAVRDELNRFLPRDARLSESLSFEERHRKMNDWAGTRQAETLAMNSIAWGLRSDAWLLLVAAKQARESALNTLGTAAGEPFDPAPGLNTRQRLDLLLEQSITRAVESERRITGGHGSPDVGWDLLLRLYEEFPTNLVILNGISEYHRVTRFDSEQLQALRDFILEADPNNRPTRWRNGIMHRHRPDMAIQRFRHVYHFDPFSPSVAYDLVEESQSLAMYDQAERFNTRLSQILPNSYSAHANQVLLAVSNEKRPPTAQEVAKLVNHHQANLEWAHQWIAFQFSKYERDTEARAHYDQLVALGNASRSAINEYAYLLRELGEFDEAVRVMESFLDRDSTSLTAAHQMIDLSELYRLTGDRDMAVQWHGRAARIDNWMGRTITNEAELAFQTGDHRGALQAFQRAHNRYEGSYTLAQMAYIHALDGNENAAWQAIEQSMRDSTCHYCAEVLVIIGHILDDFPRVQRNLEVYAGLHPPNVLRWQPGFTRAKYYESIGEYGQAWNSMMSSISQRAEGRLVFDQLDFAIDVLIKLGEYDEARRLNEMLKTEHWSSRTWRIHEGQLHVINGDYEAALQVLEKSINADYSRAKVVAGEALLKLNRAEEAVSLLETADYGIFSQPHLLLLLGDAYMATGRVNDAAEAWEQAVESRGPRNPYSRLAAERLSAQSGQ